MVIKDNVIRGTLDSKTVDLKFSQRSTNEVGDLFKKMFPESNIAHPKAFTNKMCLRYKSWFSTPFQVSFGR